MYKVTREVLTSTSERKSGFDTADDEFETDDDRILRSSNSLRLGSRSKDFRSTDEDADIDDWQDTDTFARFTLNSSARSKSATLDEKGKCTCCPYGYHVDLDFLKHLNADEYENVMSDPRYLLKHHKRLHQMQQQQFQQRASSASTSANVASVSATGSQMFQQQQQQHHHQHHHQHQQHEQQQQHHHQHQQHEQQQQHHHQQQQHHQQQEQRQFTQQAEKSFQTQSHQQQHQYHLQQQQQQQHATLRSKSPHTITTIHPTHLSAKEDPTYENALAIYNKSAATGGSNTMSSTTRTTLGRGLGTNGYHPGTYSTTTNGYDPDGVKRQENVTVGDDGSTTTRVIEEVHRTRTTIINFDSEDDETDPSQKRPVVTRKPKPALSPEPTSPVYEKEDKLLPRQQHLIELQKKLQQIQPVDHRGPLRTYVNAADPQPVTEEDHDDPDRQSKNRIPSFRPKPDEEEEMARKDPVSRSNRDPDPDWLNEKNDLLKKIRDLEQDKLQEKRVRDVDKDDYDKRVNELEIENKRKADDFKNQLSLLDKQLKSKEKVTRDRGVGDEKVDDESYTTVKHFQVTGTAGQQPVRIHEKELNTEETTEIREKEVKTIFVSGIDDKFSLAVANQPSLVLQHKEVKSIGVGDGDVFDDSQSRMEVHEKELRTVYIGGPEQGKVATRNVGILCKAAMRDVAMLHNTEDEKPMVKNACVGAGEIGVSESDVKFVQEGTERALVNQNAAVRGEGDEGDESYFASSGFCHTTLTNIKGGGMAGLKGDKLKAYLDEVLKRTVHSVATQCQFSTENKGIDATRVGYDMASVGVSDDTIDVEVRPYAVMKSVAIDHRPSLFHRCTGTEIMFKMDVGTNTRPQETYSSKGINTDPKPVHPAATMTDPTRQQNAQTGTELPIFFALDQYRSTGSMTDDVDMYNKRVNTETTEETQQRIGSSMTSSSVMEASTSQTNEAREIRRGEEQATGYRRYVEETVTPGYLISHTRTSRTRTHKEGTSPTRPISSGRDDSKAGYTTSTVIHTRDKSPRRVTFETGGITADIMTSGNLLGVDRVTKSSKTSEVDGVSQIVTETVGPGYTEKVVKESYSSTSGKPAGIPLVPGVAGFPKEFFTEGGMSSMSSSSSYTSSSQAGSSVIPVVPERMSRTKMVSGSSGTLTKTEVDERTGMKRYITETKGPGYSETTIKSSYTNVGGEGGIFGLEFKADASGKVPVQSVKGPYYTEKTVPTSGGDQRGGAVIEMEFSAGGGGTSVVQTLQEGKHYVTEVQCPGHKTAQVLVNEPIPIKIDESGVSVLQSSGAHSIKSSTEKRMYSSSSSSAEGSMREQSTLSGEGTGIKTVIRESYGPNNIKTITTEKVDMKSGQVISSSTTQTHYDTLPKFEDSSSTKTNFDFVKSSLTSERFVPDQELAHACNSYSIWIKDNSKFSQTQVGEIESIVFNRWLHAAGGETSNIHLVKSFIAYLNELSPELLKRVINSNDENGNTVLHFALSHSRMDIVNILLLTGVVNVDMANKVGNTPILISALTVEPNEFNLEVLRKLYSLGNVNARTLGSGQTALMLATGRGRIEIVELLLSSDCCHSDVNVKDSDGFTALICAAQKGHTDIVRMLLATGKCDVLIKNNEGKTALDIAKNVGHEFIVSQLESHLKGLKK